MARQTIIYGGLMGLLAWSIPVCAHADPIITPLIAAAIASTSTSLVASGAIVTAVASVITAGIVTGIGIGISTIAGSGKGNAAKAPSYAAFGNQALNLRQDSIDTRKLIYGRARTSGLLAFAGTGSGSSSYKNRLLYMAVAYAGHEVEDFDELWLDENILTGISGDSGFATNSRYRASGNDNYSSGFQLAFCRKHYGEPTQVADVSLVAAFSGWTNAHVGNDIAYVYYRLSHSPDRFPNGIPNPSAVIKGKKIYDPRSTTTAYSNNWALVIRDFLTDPVLGCGIPESEIDDDSVIASANVSDEDVTLKDGTTQKRYTIDGIVRADEPKLEVLQKMAACGAGAIVYTQGKFYIHAGYYEAPAITIDRSWLAEDIKVTPRPSRDELFNAVSGIYTEPDKKWLVTDFPMVTNATYEAQDGDEQLVKDIELPYVTQVERAQRLAKIALEKSRQAIRCTLKCNLKALQVKTWDIVALTEPLLGWNEKPFRVTDWKIGNDFKIEMTLQEESEGIYDWAAGEATTYDLAPDTELPDPTVTQPPQALTVTEDLYSSTAGSGIKTKAVLEWTEAEESFFDRYEVSYRLESDSVYTPAGFTRQNRFEIFDMDPGRYVFQVFTRSTAGVLSEPAEAAKELFGLTAPPSNVTNFRIQAIDGQANLAWDQSADLDVKIGGSFEIRHTSRTTGYSWSDGIQIGPALSGISTNQSLPLLAGTYMIKAVDSTGNKSVNYTAVTVPSVNISGLTTIETATQDPSFAGTKTNMVVNSTDDTLRLDGTALFDSVSGDFDDATGFFDYGDGAGFYTSGTYLFKDSLGNDYIDLGASYSGRVQVLYNGLIYDAAEDFDSAGGLFDDRPGEFDGTNIDDVITVFEIRTTDDDPSGSPTWSAWQQFQVGDYNFRACQIRMTVTSAQDSYNIAIDELSATITLQSRTERFEDQSVLASTTGVSITYALPFFQKPNVRVMIQGTVSGDTEKITHSVSGGVYNGVKIEILNGGSNVARTVDVFALGV